MRWFVNILFLFSSVGSTLQAAQPTLRLRLNRLCAMVVEAAVAPRTLDEMNTLFEQTLFTEIPIFRSGHPHSAEFRAVAWNAAVRQIALGRPALLAQHGVAGVAEHLWYPGMTPADFQAALERAETESLPLTNRAARGVEEVPWGEIPIAPVSTLLQGSVSNFRKSGMRIYAMPAEQAVSRQIPFLERQLQNAIASGLMSDTTGPIEDHAIPALMSALERYGVYDPRAEKKGVYLASSFVLATPSEYLMHEITHASQDVSWDLAALLDVFNRGFRNRTSESPDKYVEHLLELRKFEFLDVSMDPSYRKQIWDLGQSMGFGAFDWIYFFDFYVLLTELDAHRQAATLARENGKQSAELADDKAIFRYVFEVYYAKQKRLTALCLSLERLEGPVLSIVDWLNENRKYRSNIASP